MPRKAKIQKHKGVFEREPGSGIWWARYTDVDAKRKTRCVGAFGDAKNWIEEQRANVRKGIVAPVLTHRGVRYTALVDAALKYSEGSHKDVRNFTQRVEETRVKFGNRVAASIKPDEIADWLEEMEDMREWEPGTVNRYRAAMSKVFKLALQGEKVQRNPVSLIPQRKESAGRLRYLTNEEETRLRTVLADRPHCIPQLDIALHTGMRKGEQFSVEWPQVDVKDKYIYLDETKNGSSRYVSLNSEAIRSLAELKKEHDRLKLPADSKLFLASRKNETIADPRMWFTAACEEAKITGVTWHTLRHTFASRLAMANVHMKTLQELMGHKTMAMTARYAHLSPGHKLEALERLVQAA